MDAFGSHTMLTRGFQTCNDPRWKDNWETYFKSLEKKSKLRRGQGSFPNALLCLLHTFSSSGTLFERWGLFAGFEKYSRSKKKRCPRHSCGKDVNRSDPGRSVELSRCSSAYQLSLGHMGSKFMPSDVLPYVVLVSFVHYIPDFIHRNL